MNVQFGQCLKAFTTNSTTKNFDVVALSVRLSGPSLREEEQAVSISDIDGFAETLSGKSGKESSQPVICTIARISHVRLDTIAHAGFANVD